MNVCVQAGECPVGGTPGMRWPNGMGRGGTAGSGWSHGRGAVQAFLPPRSGGRSPLRKCVTCQDETVWPYVLVIVVIVVVVVP